MKHETETILIRYDEGVLQVGHSWPCEKCDGAGRVPYACESFTGSAPCPDADCVNGLVTDPRCFCEVCTFIRDREFAKAKRSMGNV